LSPERFSLRRRGRYRTVSRALADFSFDDETISWLVNERIVSNDLATFLSTYRFKGNVYGYSKATSSRHFRQYFGSKVDSAI